MRALSRSILKINSFFRAAQRLLLRGAARMEDHLVPLFLAGLALLLVAFRPVSAEPPAEPPDDATSDRERLEEVEQQVQILKRKLEVQEEESALQASRAATAGAGPDGFFLRSPDGKFQIKLRGYTQFDSRWLTRGEDAGGDTFVVPPRR